MAVPGKQQLKVEKDDFKVIMKTFEIATNDKKTITAQLIPLKKTTTISIGTITNPPEQHAAARKMVENAKLISEDGHWQRSSDEVPQHRVKLTRPLVKGHARECS